MDDGNLVVQTLFVTGPVTTSYRWPGEWGYRAFKKSDATSAFSATRMTVVGERERTPRDQEDRLHDRNRTTRPIYPMPLSEPTNRRDIHTRTIEVRAFARDDELFDVEARLVDRKPFAFWRVAQREPTPPGEPLHDISIRLTVDKALIVRGVEASSDTTPFDICREAEATLAPLVGERIAAGWSSKVKTSLRGTQSCTHLMEMLITMATPALQGIRGLAREHQVDDTTLGTGKLDSCYAYSAQRAVIKMHWPEHYREPRNLKPDGEQPRSEAGRYGET